MRACPAGFEPAAGLPESFHKGVLLFHSSACPIAMAFQIPNMTTISRKRVPDKFHACFDFAARFFVPRICPVMELSGTRTDKHYANTCGGGGRAQQIGRDPGFARPLGRAMGSRDNVKVHFFPLDEYPCFHSKRPSAANEDRLQFAVTLFPGYSPATIIPHPTARGIAARGFFKACTDAAALFFSFSQRLTPATGRQAIPRCQPIHWCPLRY